VGGQTRRQFVQNVPQGISRCLTIDASCPLVLCRKKKKALTREETGNLPWSGADRHAKLTRRKESKRPLQQKGSTHGLLYGWCAGIVRKKKNNPLKLKGRGDLWN